MNWHQAWLWMWYLVGAFTYMLQRSYYGVYGPHPVGTSYANYFKRCAVPLFARFVVDSAIYWATFTPQLLAAALRAVGWQEYGDMIETLSKYGPVALGFGLIMDFAVDFAVTKIPVLRDVWPQMPAPLPQPPANPAP